MPPRESRLIRPAAFDGDAEALVHPLFLHPTRYAAARPRLRDHDRGGRGAAAGVEIPAPRPAVPGSGYHTGDLAEGRRP